MKDTQEIVDQQYMTMMMQRSGNERLAMGCSMYDTAKEIVKSSILEKDPNISQLEMKREIFNRFYGLEFTEEQKAKIYESCQ